MEGIRDSKMAIEFTCKSLAGCIAPACLCPRREIKSKLHKRVSKITVVAGLEQQLFDDYVMNKISRQVFEHQIARLGRIKASLFSQSQTNDESVT